MIFPSLVISSGLSRMSRTLGAAMMSMERRFMTMFRSDANFTGPHMEKSNNLTGGL
jgi:hypothetical protein